MDIFRHLGSLEDALNHVLVLLDFIVEIGLVNLIQDVGEFADEVSDNEQACEHQDGGDPEGLELGWANVVAENVEEVHEKHQHVLALVIFIIDTVIELQLLCQWDESVIVNEIGVDRLAVLAVFDLFTEVVGNPHELDPEARNQIEVNRNENQHLHHFHAKFEIGIKLEVMYQSAKSEQPRQLHHADQVPRILIDLGFGKYPYKILKWNSSEKIDQEPAF